MVTFPPEHLAPASAPATTPSPRPGRPTLAAGSDDGWMAEGRPLSRPTRRALRGLIRALCPPEPHLDGLEDRLEVCTRRMITYMHPMTARGFKISVHMLDWAPLWRLRGLRRLHRMDREEASALLTELAASRWALVRTMVVAVRAIILCQFFDQPETHEAMAYDPVPFTRQRIALREARHRGVARQEAMIGHLSPSTRRELP